MSVLDVCGDMGSNWVYIYSKLRCLIVGEIFSSPPSWAVVLNGEVKVRLTTCTVCSQGRTWKTIRAVLSWDPCLRGLSGW